MRIRFVPTKRGVALLIGALVLTPLAGAADTVGDKAFRGFAAVTTPFLEIPGNIVRESEEEGAASGWTIGLAMGLGMSIVRPAVGIYELVTAPWPAPPNYEPILRPEYPWSYFDESTAVRPSLARADDEY